MDGSSPPIDHAVFSVRGSASNVRVARGMVRAALGSSHPALADVELLASEVITNAVCHTISGANGKVSVEVRITAKLIRVAVTDQGGTDSYPHVTESLYGENGRGLMIVRSLALDWGIRAAEFGRTVWFEVAA